MNNLFSYSKIAGFATLAVLVFDVILMALSKTTPVTGIIVNAIINCLWIAFFGLLISNSARKSPVIIPSWIAIGAFAAAFLSSCISTYGQELIIHQSEKWETISTVFKLSNGLFYLRGIAGAVAFVWLSKYFEKGSALKIVSIAIAALAIGLILSNLCIHPWKIENVETQITVQMLISIFWEIATVIPYALFFLCFSKLKK